MCATSRDWFDPIQSRHTQSAHRTKSPENSAHWQNCLTACLVQLQRTFCCFEHIGVADTSRASWWGCFCGETKFAGCLQGHALHLETHCPEEPRARVLFVLFLKLGVELCALVGSFVWWTALPGKDTGILWLRGARACVVSLPHDVVLLWADCACLISGQLKSKPNGPKIVKQDWKMCHFTRNSRAVCALTW